MLHWCIDKGLKLPGLLIWCCLWALILYTNKKYYLPYIFSEVSYLHASQAHQKYTWSIFLRDSFRHNLNAKENSYQFYRLCCSILMCTAHSTTDIYGFLFYFVDDLSEFKVLWQFFKEHKCLFFSADSSIDSPAGDPQYT